MILEIIPAGGIHASRPIVLEVSQVVIRQDNGTIIAVAAEYGEKSQAVAKIGDPDFNRVLRTLGIKETVVCHWLETPKPPPGARLLSSPVQRP